MIDLDGTFTYSQTRTVRILANGQTVSIYPNPANTYLNVNVPADMRNPRITLLNAGGQIMMMQSGNGRLDVSTVPAGVYMIMISSDRQATVTQRISIAH